MLKRKLQTEIFFVFSEYFKSIYIAANLSNEMKAIKYTNKTRKLSDKDKEEMTQKSK